MKIPLSKILDNPYRDFELDPLSDERVSDMEKSIDSLGFWGGLAARKVGDNYELAFGHHRIQALRNLGITEADIKIVKYDDDQMVSSMTKENATQRGSESGSDVDSTAAVIRRLGYMMLTKTDEELLSLTNLSARIFDSKIALDRVRNKFLAGGGIGEPTISNWEPSIGYHGVKDAIKSLKHSGYMDKLLSIVQEKIEREAIAAQAAANKLKAVKAKKEAQAAADTLTKASEATELKISENKPAEIFFDPGVHKVFDNRSHTAAFRKVVTSEAGKKYLPHQQHVAMAKKIVKTAEEDKKINNISAAYITKSVKTVLKDAMNFAKIEKLKLEQQEADEAAATAYKNLVGGVNKASKAGAALIAAIEKGGKLNNRTKAQAFVSVDGQALTSTLAEIETVIDDNTVISTQ